MANMIFSLILSGISVTCAVAVALTNGRRNQKTDDKKEATELTTVIVKLENIGDDTKEIKNELRSIRTEVSELRERVIITEQATRALHQRVDNMEKRMSHSAKNE